MSSSSGGAILSPEDENDAEVRRVDQDNINKFGQLNARLYEVRDEKKRIKKKMDQLDDASTELMMGNGDKVLLSLGEAFFEVDEDEATLFCEEEIEKNQKLLDALEGEEEDILAQQSDLKSVLYGRFGKSINLEDK